jgi:hypothetical protein
MPADMDEKVPLDVSKRALKTGTAIVSVFWLATKMSALLMPRPVEALSVLDVVTNVITGPCISMYSILYSLQSHEINTLCSLHKVKWRIASVLEPVWYAEELKLSM